jgi:prolyl-tRNA editing enzyme YbaK/EbsC (Cys-tRNA(Pro) deacylase)
MADPDFACHVCGAQCAIAPEPPAKTVCQEHCEDHEYVYIASEGKRCIHCHAEPPDDWFDVEEIPSRAY